MGEKRIRSKLKAFVERRRLVSNLLRRYNHLCHQTIELCISKVLLMKVGLETVQGSLELDCGLEGSRKAEVRGVLHRVGKAH
jgi:hypothetical protein